MIEVRVLLSAFRRAALCLLLLSGVAPARADIGQTEGHADLQAIAPMIAAGVELWRKATETGRERIAVVAAPYLAQWITTARTDSIAAGIQPIPPAIRIQLAGYVPTLVMDRVRYRIGWPESQGLQSDVFRLLQARAITLKDVIVFRDKDIASDPAIWVHELEHVQQYDRWGAEEFARRYLRAPDDIETEAWDATAGYRMWTLEGRPSTQARSATHDRR